MIYYITEFPRKPNAQLSDPSKTGIPVPPAGPGLCTAAAASGPRSHYSLWSSHPSGPPASQAHEKEV